MIIPPGLLGFLGGLLAKAIGVQFFQGLGKQAGKSIRQWRSGKTLRSRKLVGTLAEMGEVHYRLTNEINPDTGNPFYQFLYITNGKFDLEDIFDSSIRDKIVKSMSKASTHCTDDERIVVEHLKKVASKKDLEDLTGAISYECKNFFSAYFNKHSVGTLDDLKKGLYMQYTKRFMVLVHEKGGFVEHFSIRNHMEKNDWDRPNLEDIKFFYKGSWIKSGHILNDGTPYVPVKYHTDIMLDKAIKNNRALWEDSLVLIETGKIIDAFNDQANFNHENMPIAEALPIAKPQEYNRSNGMAP